MLSWMPTHPKEHPSQSFNLYRHAFDTPMSIFITCICDKNYSVLVRFGRATQEEIMSAWERIYTEYMDLSGSPQFRYAFNAIKEIGKLESRFLTLRTAHQVLSFQHSQKCISAIAAVGCPLDFGDEYGTKKYNDALNTLADRAKVASMQLERSRIEHKTMTDTNKNVVTMTREAFDQQLSILSKYVGFDLDPRNVTISRFASYQMIYRKEMEQLEERAAKMQKGYGYNKNK